MRIAPLYIMRWFTEFHRNIVKAENIFYNLNHGRKKRKIV